MDLAWLIVKNQVLSILTLGIYGFWGKVALRKYMSQQTEFNGKSFNYSGTGGELFVGALKFGAFIFISTTVMGTLYFASVALLAKLSPKLLVLFGLGLNTGVSLTLAFLMGYGEYSARRFFMSRTQWGGYQFALRSKAFDFAKLYVKNRLLMMITLGFYYPIAKNKEYAFKMNHTTLGDLSFRYSGSDKFAMSLFLRHLPVILITLGLGYVWYLAALKRYRSEHTWLGSKTNGAVRGRLKVSGMDLFTLYLLNSLCLIVTFGLATPWIFAHNYSFQLSRFDFVGMADFSNIVDKPSTGESTGDIFASSMFIGFVI